MKRPTKVATIALSGVLLAVGVAIVVRYTWLLDGQAASLERVVRTSTGGTPTYNTIQYRAKDARPAIMEPTFVAADQATMVGGTMGIGVDVGGQPRFYPLYIMQYHQVVNDTCGDKAIVCSC